MNDSTVSKIAVLTSGGDSPGMNAAIRGVVRQGLKRGIEVIGCRHGYQGLLSNDYTPLTRESVSNIIHLGGSILTSSRCEEFREPQGREKAFKNCRAQGIDALIVIGGNGSSQGAFLLQKETGMKSIVLPGTIDNDIYGSNWSIGFDTAVNTALESVDRIRDTANAMERIFFVEVMGRHCGNIAIHAGVASGADYVVIPEIPTEIDLLCQEIKQDAQTKHTVLIVVSEGDDFGNAHKISQALFEKTGLKSWVTNLGHVQRGGSPTSRDRFFATATAVAAVNDLAEGKGGTLMGVAQNSLVRVPLEKAANKKKSLDHSFLKLLDLQH